MKEVRTLIALTNFDIRILRSDCQIEEMKVKGRNSLIYAGGDLEEDTILTVEKGSISPEVGEVEPTEKILKIGSKEIPVARVTGKVVSNMPEEQEGTAYIVSSVVQNALPDRGDIYAPSDIVCKLNDDGTTTVIGTRGLKQI